MICRRFFPSAASRGRRFFFCVRWMTSVVRALGISTCSDKSANPSMSLMNIPLIANVSHSRWVERKKSERLTRRIIQQSIFVSIPDVCTPLRHSMIHRIFSLEHRCQLIHSHTLSVVFIWLSFSGKEENRWSYDNKSFSPSQVLTWRAWMSSRGI